MDNEKYNVSELTEKELEHVTGGAKFVLSEVNVGDVFMIASTAIVIKSNVTDDGSNAGVPTISATKIGNDWVKTGEKIVYFNELKDFCTYSPALSGTLNYLL